ncbi:uncharacterized protein A4U43_C05F17570 [Asparagus officinalis]|uniref:Pentatricopeptide repeat-containing protein n=1 Tax=Asparagus officinalis TaxID=4686 RepID=A0A5P1ESJ9_ASPOF|nr:uncharacterized protein A4U43_C05F17570 [Asparagus officinalis]
MASSSCALPEYTLSKLLKSPSFSQKHLKAIHSRIIKLGLSNSTILVTSLINSCVKSNLLADAHQTFDELPHRDLVAWTSMITGHAHLSFHQKSLSFFRRMIGSDVALDAFSFSNALVTCSGIKGLNLGREIHAQAIKRPFDRVVCNGLIGFYINCHCVAYAERVFELVPVEEFYLE